MAVKIETDRLNATGKVSAAGGTFDSRGDPRGARDAEGNTFVAGTRVTALGELVLAEDGKTVEFVPDDPAELEAAVLADEEA
jgi:hypothetical protein